MRALLRRDVERRADIADRDAEGRRAVAVDLDAGARQIEIERILREDDLAGLHRLGADLLRDLVDLLGRAEGAQNVLDRETAAGSGERWRAEDDGIEARRLGEALLNLRLDLRGAPRALIPRLEAPNRERRVRAAETDDRELALQLGNRSDEARQLRDIGLRIVGRRIARALHLREENALVFGGGELRLRVDEEERRGAENHHDDDEDQRTRIESLV